MSSNMARRGAIAGVLAAALLVVLAILSRVAPVGPVYQTSMDYLYQVVSVLAFGAIIGAILCLDAWQRPYPGYGRVGHIGSILASLGYAIVLLVVIINIALGGWHLTPVRIVGAVTVLVGSALLGVATIRARKMPWWCGVLLIVAFPIGDIVDGMFAGGEAIMLALLWGLRGCGTVEANHLDCSTRRAAPGCILRPPPPPHLGPGGDLAVEVPYGSRDEIGDLGTAFNDMASEAWERFDVRGSGRSFLCERGQLAARVRFRGRSGCLPAEGGA